MRVAGAGACSIYLASDKHWMQLSDTVHGQGIIAIAAMPEENTQSHLWSDRILLLDRVQDPGNLGTILRTAEAFGFEDVLLAKGCADPFDGKSLRASMGGVFTLRLQSMVVGFISGSKGQGLPMRGQRSPKFGRLVGSENVPTGGFDYRQRGERGSGELAG